jgi:hypothetical protein
MGLFGDAPPSRATDPEGILTAAPALFDPEFYVAQVGRPLPDPLGHFRRSGDAAGLDPCPYFSTRFYKETYPDWETGGASTALEDFLHHESAGTFRKPHPLIDPLDYLARYPDLVAAKVRPVQHFARLGDAEGRTPSAEFDAAFYARCYLRLGETGAFAHFIREGRAAGHLPVPDLQRAEQSSQAAAEALRGLGNPVVLAVHDAQEAGAPILTLDLARAFRAGGFTPLFLLQHGGPLVAAFRALGPVFLIAEGWDAGGILGAVPPKVPVIVNSAVAAALAQHGATTGHPTLLLIHEMRDYLRAQSLMPALRDAQQAGARLAASVPRMAEALRPDLGELPVLRPGILSPTPSCRMQRDLRRRFAGKALFIGAGHADRRKGFDLFLEAARGIRAECAEAEFVWLGALDAWAQGLADKAKAAGLPLTLPGFVADPSAWYAQSRVYLLTSRQDPGPTTLVQAAAMGVPFLGYAADIGLRGIADHVGRFIQPERPADYVQAALDLAATDSRANRRARRREVLRLADFTTYAQAVLNGVSPRS